ncbi:hypothetical protein JCM15764A_23090 [Geotalea toluenoxydans]
MADFVDEFIENKIPAVELLVDKIPGGSIVAGIQMNNASWARLTQLFEPIGKIEAVTDAFKALDIIILPVICAKEI